MPFTPPPARMEGEPPSVETGVRKDYIGRKDNLLNDLIGDEVHGNQLGAAGSHLIVDHPSIKNPEPGSRRIDYHTLHGNQLVGGVVGIGVAIYLRVGIRERLSTLYFRHGVFNRITGPLREAHKNSTAVGNSDTGWHRTIERSDDLQLANHSFRWEFLPCARGCQQSKKHEFQHRILSCYLHIA